VEPGLTSPASDSGGHRSRKEPLPVVAHQRRRTGGFRLKSLQIPTRGGSSFIANPANAIHCGDPWNLMRDLGPPWPQLRIATMPTTDAAPCFVPQIGRECRSVGPKTVCQRGSAGPPRALRLFDWQGAAVRSLMCRCVWALNRPHRWKGSSPKRRFRYMSKQRPSI